MKYYRPAPLTADGNFYNEIVTDLLKKEGWFPLGFKYWNPYHLFRNRKQCKLIHMHWPEGQWRSEKKVVCYLKAFWFLTLFYSAKQMGYKWAFSAHNVIPHYKVKSPALERLMRFFILKNFDLIIGLAFNTKIDLELAFGTSGKKYVLCLHGAYVDSYPIKKTREKFREEFGIPIESKVILSMNNTTGRENKGVDELLEAWSKIHDSKNVHLLLTGLRPNKLNDLVANSKFHFIEGRIPDDMMGDLFNSVDFLFLNYKSITTSGMFFLSVAFNLPIIVPNLPFFKLQSSDKTSLFYDYEKPLSVQLESIFAKIIDGWSPDDEEFEEMKTIYNYSRSAKINAAAFNSLFH